MLSIFLSIRCLGLLGASLMLRSCVVCVFVMAIGHVQAQSHQILGVLHLNAGWQDYRESEMQSTGPELGVYWQSLNLAPYTLEVDANLGLQNYTSGQSGRLNQVLNFDTRWQALRVSSAQPQWQFGLALHSHANFLRGTTSLGFGGYDRLSLQVWVPVRWHSASAQPWTVDAGWLLWGEHLSRLSQVNTRLEDVTNTQRKGVYFQVSKKVNSSQGELEPYARWTWVDRSDVREVALAGQVLGAYEPENTRLQIGVKWRFR